MECRSIGGISFNMKQTISVEGSVILDPKKLSLKYKNEYLKSEIYLNGARVREIQRLTNGDVVAISFVKRLLRNDTIQLDLNEFLHCRNKPINVGNIHLVLLVSAKREFHMSNSLKQMS